MAGILNGTKGVLIVFCAVGALVYLVSGSSNGPVASPSRADASPAPVQIALTPPAIRAGHDAAPAEKESANVASEWSYDQSKDDLRNETTYYASLDSANKLQLGFPYGESGAKIVLRRKTKAVDVMVTLDSGQFICNSFTGDTVAVKFDDGKIQHFACAESTDGSTNVIFLRNEAKFVRELKDANRVQIEAQFFQAGLQQLAFNSSGLKF